MIRLGGSSLIWCPCSCVTSKGTGRPRKLAGLRTREGLLSVDLGDRNPHRQRAPQIRFSTFGQGTWRASSFCVASAINSSNFVQLRADVPHQGYRRKLLGSMGDVLILAPRSTVCDASKSGPGSRPSLESAGAARIFSRLLPFRKASDAVAGDRNGLQLGNSLSRQTLTSNRTKIAHT